MEAQSEYTNNHNTSSSSSWSCATNWTISHGSLDTCITLDSSDYPAVDSSVTLNPTTPNSPLLLKSPPSSDSGPCEIKSEYFTIQIPPFFLFQFCNFFLPLIITQHWMHADLEWKVFNFLAPHLFMSSEYSMGIRTELLSFINKCTNIQFINFKISRSICATKRAF